MELWVYRIWPGDISFKCSQIISSRNLRWSHCIECEQEDGHGLHIRELACFFPSPTPVNTEAIVPIGPGKEKKFHPRIIKHMESYSLALYKFDYLATLNASFQMFS